MIVRVSSSIQIEEDLGSLELQDFIHKNYSRFQHLPPRKLEFFKGQLFATAILNTDTGLTLSLNRDPTIPMFNPYNNNFDQNKKEANLVKLLTSEEHIREEGLRVLSTLIGAKNYLDYLGYKPIECEYSRIRLTKLIMARASFLME